MEDEKMISCEREYQQGSETKDWRLRKSNTQKKYSVKPVVSVHTHGVEKSQQGLVEIMRQTNVW